MAKIKRDDEVIVIAGKDRGKRGTVTRVLDDQRVFVSGINMIKRHTKPNPQIGNNGGIIEKEAPLNISNLAIFNPATAKADRVGYAFDENGNKYRVFKSSGDRIDG